MRRGIRRFLIEPEVDGESEDHVDRFAFQRAGLEFPLLHGVDGGLIAAERERLATGDILYETGAPDDRPDACEAVDPSLPRLLGVHRLDPLHQDRRSNIASYADRAV